MTLPRLEAITKRWAEVPPLAVSVAAIATALGMERPKGHNRKSPESLQSLVDALGGTGFNSEKPAWLQDQTTMS